MGNTNKITGYILIALVVFTIAMQVKLYFTFLKNKEMFDNDPLVYAAVKYNIENCECVLSQTTKVIFNQNESRTIINQRGYDYTPLNISWDK